MFKFKESIEYNNIKQLLITKVFRKKGYRFCIFCVCI